MKAAEFCRSPFSRPHPPTLQTSTSARHLRPQADSFSPCLITSELSIADTQLERQVQCYEWRKRTEFPIVKIHDYQTMRRQGCSTTLSLRYQNYPIRLSQLRSVPLFKILYLFKEAIIGFERLYDRFGPFQVSSRMVALTQNNKCKVWLNEQFEKNGYAAVKMEEKDFLLSIVRIFSEIGNQLKNTLHFFKELSQFSSFCQALAFIENYARENKISIPTSCKVNGKEIVIVEIKPEPTFNPSLTMNRSPKFLSNVNLRGSLKPSARVVFEPVVSQLKQQQKIDGLNMKTSGDTAADIYGSNTHSQSNLGQKETFDESIIFGETQPQPVKLPEVFLQFSKSMKKHHLPFRKQLSQMTPVNSYFLSESINCIQPQPHFKSYRQVESQSQSEQENAETMAGIFHKNNWQKSINGLFTESSEMKHSTHHGQQKRKTPLFPQKKLLLLQQVSKGIHESLINEQDMSGMTMQI